MCDIEDGYVLQPERGILQPGAQVHVQLELDGWFIDVLCISLI
jgi:hypothetical protein